MGQPTCLSDIFTPWRYITESENAVDKHSRPRILNICAATSVSKLSY